MTSWMRFVRFQRQSGLASASIERRRSTTPSAFVASTSMQRAGPPESRGCRRSRFLGSLTVWRSRQSSFACAWPTPGRDVRSCDRVLVTTHLTRKNQVLWVEELRRILRPGALCLLTLHGEGEAEFLGPKFLALLQEKGIDDGSLDPVLDSIAPAGYYRATYQSRDYTMREFSRFFDVVEYLDSTYYRMLGR